MEMEKWNSVPTQSRLLDDGMKAQICSVLEKLTEDVWVRAVINPAEEKSMEMAAFLKAFTALSGRLHLALYEPGEAAQVEEELECGGLYPVTGLYLEETHFCGISFKGIPGGREINSFVIAFYNAAGAGQALTETVKERIMALHRQRSLLIFVSLSCHYCAENVILAQHIAAASGCIKAQMVDAGLYPQLVEKYGLERVPVMILDEDKRLTGGKTIEELLDFLEAE